MLHGIPFQEIFQKPQHVLQKLSLSIAFILTRLTKKKSFHVFYPKAFNKKTFFIRLHIPFLFMVSSHTKFHIESFGI